MDYSTRIALLQDAVNQLRHIKETLLKTGDTICSIEDRVGEIESSLPADASAIDDPTEREQVSHAEDLISEAYALVDDMIGPPEEQQSMEFGDRLKS